MQRGLQGPTQWSNQTTVRLPQAECILDLGSELVSGLWPSTLAVNEISNPAQLQGERPVPSSRAEIVALSGRKRFPSGAFLFRFEFEEENPPSPRLIYTSVLVRSRRTRTR